MKQRRILTVSALETFARCPQAYNLRYNQLIYPALYSSALSLGGAVHEGLEQLNCGLSLNKAIAAASGQLDSRRDQALSSLAPEYQADLTGQVEKDKAKARTIIRAHFRHWRVIVGGDRSRDLEFEFFDTERTIGPVPLINPKTGAPSRTFALAGKVDAIVGLKKRPEAGRLVYELKTTSDALKDFEIAIRQSIQPQLYAVLIRQLLTGEFELSGIVIDAVKKPTLRGRKGETPAELEDRMLEQYSSDPANFLRRIVLPLEDSRLRDVRKLAWRAAHLIRNSDRHDYLTVKGPACRKAYGWCEYRPLCWYGDLSMFRFAETPHEELDGLPAPLPNPSVPAPNFSGDELEAA